jgi:hypothetical protein
MDEPGMKQQISFSDVEYQWKKRVTRRQRFLSEMEQVVPWQRLLQAIEPLSERPTWASADWSGAHAAAVLSTAVVWLG